MEADAKANPVDASQTINWDLFLAWVARHKIGPQAFAILSRAEGSLVPDHVLRRLTARCRKSAVTSLVLVSHMLRIIRFFQEHGIRALPFKGICTAQQIYGAEDARETGDIDIFVSSEDVDTIDGLLRTHGYQDDNLEFGLTALQKKKLREWAHSREYIHAGTAIRVDLHWRLLAYRSLFDLEFDAVWKQGEEVDLTGHKIRTLSLVHTFLLLVAHGASHGWSHLFWLYDVVELLRRNREFDWREIICEARRLGIMRHLLQAVVLGYALFGSPIPEMAYPYIERESTLADLINHSMKRLTASNPHSGTFVENVRQIRYLLRLSPKIQYKWEILWRTSLYPPDWKSFKVPDALFPLYYILRPLFWVQRKIEGRNTTPKS